ncbi:NAD(P)-dependent oxidoreductase [Rhizobium oryzicola]|uniref:NAD(P)-dependent oxidoreductase n=1 Tax=Rhizobium oryzicola TaxID=1232668 RepID=A0ABT8T3W2_9HYPH|nr:NAD(P)-dependent oxidoreductase [Rhizobium oryzicola]MDO1585444.1 NAD(P)-dependent oxidoreductase [Rhizobium oryzicola]
MTATIEIGFIGLGTMGTPMALNLLKAGTPLVVWNRSKHRSDNLAAAGARVVDHPIDVFARCRTVILMLADEQAMDAVLARGGHDFAARVCGKAIVSMGTMSPDYSRCLSDDIHAVGGVYVEAPVSGSRKPAEAGQLVAMLAGDADDVVAVRPLLAPMCRQVFECGAIPAALRMKLAVNVCLITLVTGLAEATHFAKSHNLDLTQFAAILDEGPMASDVSRIKISKLVCGDFTRQAAITDVLKNSRLVMEAARDAATSLPLMQASLALYAETEALGLGDDDMIAVIRAIEERTAGSHGKSS